MYGLVVTASDGKRMTVRWQLDTHRAECRRYVLTDFARRVHVDTPEAALEVLTTWSKERLVEHLSSFSSAQLRPPTMRK